MKAPLYDPPHWRFYQSLERDLELCFRYIPPAEEHYSVYLDEFAKIILTAASEFENVLLEIKHHSFDKSSENITGYFSCITSSLPGLISSEMLVRRFGLEFSPLLDWTVGESPDWWRNGYNKVKHDRLGHPKSPTLKRALYSVASLQIVLLGFYKLKYPEFGLPWSISPKLITPKISNSKLFYNGYIEWDWKLTSSLQ